MRRTISWMMIWAILVSSNLPLGVAEEIAEGQSDIVEQNGEIVYELEPENEPEIMQEQELEKEPEATDPVEEIEAEKEPEPVHQPEEKKEAAPTEEAGAEQEAEAEHESEDERNAEKEAETVNEEEPKAETPAPTEEATAEPTTEETPAPTEEATAEPTTEETPAPTEEATVEPLTEETIAPTNELTVEPTTEETPVPTEEPAPEMQFEAGYRLCRAGTRIYTHGNLQGEHVKLEEEGLVYAYAQTENGEGYEIAYVVDGQTEVGFVRQDKCGENLENPNKQGTTYSVDGFSGVTLPSLALEKAEDRTESPNESDAAETEEKLLDETEQQEVPANEVETLEAGESTVWTTNAVNVTANRTEAIDGEIVTFTIEAPGATRLRVRGWENEEWDVADGGFTFQWKAWGSANPEFWFEALIDGEWIECSQSIQIQCKYLGELAQTVIAAPDEIDVGQAIEVSFTPVEHATEYYVRLMQGESYIQTEYIDDETTSVTLNEIDEPGEYTLTVTARGEGYQESVTTKTLKILPLAGEAAYQTEATYNGDGVRITRYLGEETEVVVPETLNDQKVSVIDYGAFTSSKITSVQIPEGINVSSNAFGRCASLRDVYLPRTLSGIWKDSFPQSATWHVYQNTELHMNALAWRIPVELYDQREDQSGIRFTFAVGEYYEGDSVDLSVDVPEGTTQLRLYVNGAERATWQVENQTSGFECSFMLNQECTRYVVQFDALVGETWTEKCDGQVIESTYLGQLDKPELTVPVEVVALQPFSVSWAEVEGAEKYDVELLMVGEDEIERLADERIIAENTYIFSASSVNQVGSARVRVYAMGRGYTRSMDGVADITIRAESEWATESYSGDKVKLTNYLGKDENVVVPDEIDGKKLVSIGHSAFANNTSIQSVTLGTNVTEICYGAFSWCTSLEKIVIPASVETIDENAFLGSNGVTIYGYTGSYAETFAKKNNIPFESIGAVDGGNIAFELESNEVWQHGYAHLTVTAPDAEKIRLYVNDQLHPYDYSLTDGVVQIQTERLNELGEYAIAVSQSVNGAWQVRTPKKTVTVKKVSVPEIEPIDPVKMGEKLIVRWKPVDQACSYDVLCNVPDAVWDEEYTAEPDEQGYIAFEADESWTKALGENEVEILANMSDGGYGEYAKAVYHVTGDLQKPTFTLSQTRFACNQPIKISMSGAEKEEFGHTVVFELTNASDEVQKWAFLADEGDWVTFDDAYAGVFDLTGRYAQGDVWSEKSDPIRVEILKEASPDDSVPVPTYTAKTEWNQTDEKPHLIIDIDKSDADIVNVVWVEENGSRHSMSREPGLGLAIECEPLQTYRFSMQAWKDGKCSPYSPEQVITIPEHEMDAPVIEPVEDILLHQDELTVRWKAVENAEKYRVSLYSNDDPVSRFTGSGYLTEAGEYVFQGLNDWEAGTYTVEVKAYGKQYYGDSTATTTAQIICYGDLEAPKLVLPEKIVRQCFAEIEVGKVQNAEKYRVIVYMDRDKMRCKTYDYTNGDASDQGDAFLEQIYFDEPAGTELEFSVVSMADGYVYGHSEKQYRTIIPKYEYELKNGSAVITKYNGTEDYVTVPENVDGYTVSAIGESAFEGNMNIQSVHLPDSVTSIMACGFKNCKELESVEGRGVTEIGREAFYGCEKLKTLHFESFGGMAGSGAFVGAGSIQPSQKMDVTIREGIGDGVAAPNENNPFFASITYPEGFVEIPTRTHYHNVNLGYVYLPSTMKKIGSQAFGDDAELKLVRLYDRVEQIADDAFEDSPNTTFLICVRNMDTVSYVEQYAIAHGIPYTKELYTPDAPAAPSAGISGEGVQQTTPNEYTIPVNREVWINVTGESADTAQVYLDDTVILETEFTTGEATIRHTFTEVGDYQLYAVSANGSTESQKSPVKTLHVVGTTIQASKEKVWTCEPVELKITSSVQTGTAALYADGERFVEAELTDGQASVTYGFRKAGTRQITAEVSGMRSIAANVEVMALAKLDAPKPEAQAIQPLENGITVNWNAVEHADGYVLRVLDTDGKVVAEEDIPSTGADTYSYTMETSRLQGAGSYDVYLMDYGYQYDQNQSDSVNVLLIESGKLAFTMDKTTVQTGENVRFMVVAPGFAKVEMLVDGTAIGECEVANGVVSFERAFSQSGDREIAFRALGSEDWGEPCEAQLLHVTSVGKLDAPVISVKSVHLLGMDVTLSWQSVAQADGYSLYVYDANGNLTYQSKITETGLTVPNDAFQTLGTYSLVVIAYGRGYDQAQGNAQTEVRERLAGPEIVVPNAGETLGSKDVMVTWKAVEDAAGYVITLARRTVNAAGDVVYEKVWAAPNEIIEIGDTLSYTLTGLKFGQQYRVAVGALAQKGETDATKIGWSQREFTVSLKPKKPEVTYKPTEIWPGTNVTFTITGDANTQMMDVYMIQNGEEKLIETMRNYDTNFPPKEEHIFTYAYTPEQEGTITFRFVPLNEDLEFGESCYVDVPVRKEGELPPVKLINPTQDDILLEMTTVEWEKQELRGRVFGGYYVTLEQQTQDGWKIVYNQLVSDAEHTCDLSKLEAGARYKLHVYTMKKGQTVPDAETAETTAEFGYRTVPDFAITGIDSTEIIRHDVTVRWKAPQWKRDAAQKPDSYVVWWWGGGLKHNGLDGYPMQVDGEQTSCTLPAEMVKNGGSYTAEVYAILGESQTLGRGANAFTIQTPEVQIDTAAAKDDNILSGEISLSGHVSGGAEIVVVTLLENDQPIAFTSGAYSGKALVLACSNHQYAATLTVTNPDENKTYNIRVDGFIFPEEAAKQQNVACTATRRVEAGTGRITSLRLNDASVMGRWRYHSMGATKYEVYTDGRIRQIFVSLDGEQTTFEPTVKKIENGQYVYEIELNLAEGIHNLSFATNRDSTKAETHVASIRFLNAAQTAYAGMIGANLKTWPAASWSVARKLDMNTQVLQRGTCGDYAYVKVGNVNYFVLKSELMQSAYQEETEYHIVDPKQGETKLISNEQGLVVSWTPCANAVYFDVTLIDAETNETLVKKTVKAAHSGEKLMAGLGMAMPISNESTTFTKAEFGEDFDWLQVRSMTVTVEPYGAEN